MVAALWMVLALALPGGCQPNRALQFSATPPRAATIPIPAANAPASRPAPVNWENRPKGVRLSYPAEWQPKKDPDFELKLVPTGAPAADRRITLDIPDLPPHLPFMLQLDRIQHDYLQDLKKKHPDLQTSDAAPVKLADATARLVRSNWHEARQLHDDVVLLVIHANLVYVLDAQTDDAHLANTRAAFDSIQASIKWLR